MTTKEFIYRSLSGTTKKEFCSSVIRDTDSTGNTIIYSYGKHYPLAVIINGNGYVNTAGYSATTGKHIGWAFSALAEIVGWHNTYHVPLNYNVTEFTVDTIQRGALAGRYNIQAEMNNKKRKNTQAYEWLVTKRDRMTATLNSIDTIN